MKIVITYGTYDLFHRGHLELLRRAKALGDVLIVGVSTDEFNEKEKSKFAEHSYEKRRAIVESVSFVDRVIPETCWEQKREDIARHGVSVFVMGDDWCGHFDDLKEQGCEVVYLSRTPETSSSKIRAYVGSDDDVSGIEKMSCVVTNRNGAAFIQTAVDSLLQQRLPPSEIVIADDASTDGSRDLIEKLAEQHLLIRPIFRPKRLGVSQNRDMAIRATTHNWVTSLDSDDWFNSEKLAAEARVLAANPGAVACSDTALYDLNKECFDVIHVAPLCAMSVSQRVTAIVARRKMIPRDLLMPRAVYEATGGLDPNLNMYEDWALKIRLADQGIPFVYSGVLGTSYYRRGKGLSGVGHLAHARGKIMALRSAGKNIRHSSAFWSGVFRLFMGKGPRKLLRLNRPNHEIM